MPPPAPYTAFMCNESYRRVQIVQVREDWAQLRIPLRFPRAFRTSRRSIRSGPPIASRSSARRPPRPDGGAREAEMVTRRWSWAGSSGKPVYNYRSDGRDFPNHSDSGRCLIPVEGFFEFTVSPPA